MCSHHDISYLTSHAVWVCVCVCVLATVFDWSGPLLANMLLILQYLPVSMARILSLAVPPFFFFWPSILQGNVYNVITLLRAGTLRREWETRLMHDFVHGKPKTTFRLPGNIPLLSTGCPPMPKLTSKLALSWCNRLVFYCIQLHLIAHGTVCSLLACDAKHIWKKCDNNA